MLVLVIIGYSFLVIYEVIPLYKQKLWRDFGINVALGVVSFTIAILLSLGAEIPSPIEPIREIITSIFGE